MTPDDLWQATRMNFETDDGSLPTVELSPLAPDEVAELFSAIRQAGRVKPGACFWDVEAAEARPLDSVPNAGQWVAEGRAEAFHFLVEAPVYWGVEIPSIGVHVFGDMIALDYRMGPEWTPKAVFAWFGWIARLLDGTHGAKLHPATECPPYWNDFLDAWTQFCSTARDGTLG